MKLLEMNRTSDVLLKKLQSYVVCFIFIFQNILWTQVLCTTVAYLGHGEKTNYSANPPGRNTNPPGRISQSARAE